MEQNQVEEEEEEISIFETLCDECRLTPPKLMRNNSIPQPEINVNLVDHTRMAEFKKRSFQKLPALVTPVNHLVSRSGKLPTCSVCGLASKIKCQRCHVYFCCKDHLVNCHIHKRTCDKVGFMLNPKCSDKTEVDRRRMKVLQFSVKVNVVEDLLMYAIQLMNQENYINALEALRRADDFVKDVYGVDSIQQAMLRLLMFETYIERNLVAEAEKALDSATSSVSSCGVDSPLPNINSLLQRAQGLLYLKLGQIDDAQFHFAESLYLMAIRFGPKDARCSFGYLHLAETRLLKGENARALELFEFCLSIWFEYCTLEIMSHMVVTNLDEMGTPSVSKKDQRRHKFEPLLLEGKSIVLTLRRYFIKLAKMFGPQHRNIAKCKLCVTILLYRLQDWAAALKWFWFTKSSYSGLMKVAPREPKIMIILRFLRKRILLGNGFSMLDRESQGYSKESLLEIRNAQGEKSTRSIHRTESS